MKRLLLCLSLLFMALPVLAQEPSVYATMESGQATRFDYVSTAGSVQIVNLLVLLFVSLWAMFILAVYLRRDE